tara:strand:+ start:203 stop:484 length:282 start_codon:yes stop_codon:yes gene_type:complete
MKDNLRRGGFFVDYLGIDKCITERSSKNGRHQTLFRFPNGYGASVISGDYIRKFEIAVLEGEELCYTTPITNDVIAGLEAFEVYDYLDRIRKL